ncbi:MAG: hypothetical protein FJ130_11650 [Deltaproteobacteria bacterium]|nr:hypothetical protein [Deltaproteobacteria bacterium]
MDKDLNSQNAKNWAMAGNLLVNLTSMETGFFEVHPVRNFSRCDSKPSGALNPTRIILKRNPVAEQLGIISNGVKRCRQEIWDYIEYRESLVKWPPMNEQIRGGVT